MTVTINELCNHLEAFAPLALQESYDNCGLLVGDRNQLINGVTICLDITEAVVDEAIRDKSNVIVAHHPLIFSGIKRINPNNEQGRCIIKAIKNDIAIYAAHTNMDNVSAGVNAMIAEKLQLKNTKILLPKAGTVLKLVTFVPKDKANDLREALFAAGAGNIGNYSGCSFNSLGEGTFQAEEGSNPYVGEINEPHTEQEMRMEMVLPYYAKTKVLQALLKNHPYEEVAYDLLSLSNTNSTIGSGLIGELELEMAEVPFLTSVKNAFQCQSIRHTKFLDKKVSKVAVCGGSGSFLLSEAMAQGADVFISSDFKYHQFFEAENRIIIADIGHFESEQYTMELFYELITKKFTTFAIRLTKINTNPINYL